MLVAALGTELKKRLFLQSGAKRSLGRRTLNQASVVVPDIPDALVDWIGFQPVRRAWLQDTGGIGVEIEPMSATARSKVRGESVKAVDRRRLVLSFKAPPSSSMMEARRRGGPSDATGQAHLVHHCSGDRRSGVELFRWLFWRQRTRAGIGRTDYQLIVN